jgi:lipoprotein-anchoring transpeptidase ErfK/SrfK
MSRFGLSFSRLAGRAGFAAGLVLLVGATAGCEFTPTFNLITSGQPDDSVALVHAEPLGDQPVNVTTPVVVRATNGRLETVTVVGPKGPVEGDFDSQSRTWRAHGRKLAFGSTYRVVATAVDARGRSVQLQDSFTTVEPSALFTAEVSPAEGEPVGVGMPITVTFDRAVDNRAEVERALQVVTPMPLEGAWAWNSGREVQFRPRTYWPGAMKAEIRLNLRGVQARDGVYGARDLVHTVTFGPSMVTTVNAKTFTATVQRDGTITRTIPITTGKAGWETRSGVKVIMSKERSRIMDAATGGTSRSDPEYYRLLVEYAMRVTDSGEFVHAAPWSVGYQGRANVSHGCIGMSTDNARWLYENTLVGDVVEVRGTGREQDLGNGITLWNERWSEWVARSATGPVLTEATRGISTMLVAASN